MQISIFDNGRGDGVLTERLRLGQAAVPLLGRKMALTDTL